jgi:hypothetical protein
MTPTRSRRSRPRTLELPEGERLRLDAGGSITHLAADGTAMRTWSPDDPEWQRVALRFGLHEAPATVAPSGREGIDSRLRR